MILQTNYRSQEEFSYELFVFRVKYTIINPKPKGHAPFSIIIVSAALRAALTAELAALRVRSPDLFFAKRCETAPRADSRVANKSFERNSA